MKSINLLLSLCILSTTLHSAVPLENYTIKQKGMGGISAAYLEKHTYFNQNPALLATSAKLASSFPKIEAGISRSTMDNISKILEVADGTDESDQMDKLKKLVPLKIAGNFSAQPLVALSKNNIGLSMFLQGSFGGNIVRKTSPIFNISGHMDTVIMAGIGKTYQHAATNKTIHFGVAPKIITRRTIYDKSTGENEISLTQSELLKHINGIENKEISTYTLSGFGIDVGALMPISDGTIGLTVKNLITNLKGDQIINNTTKENKENIPVVATLGSVFTKELPLIGKTNLGIDYNIMSPDKNFYKRLHMGMEKRIWKALSLRGGIHQGFIVGGFGLNLYIFQIDYAFFAEEHGLHLGDKSFFSHNIQIGVLF